MYRILTFDGGGLGWILLLLAVSGCAVRYYDRSNGTEHLWGFGHLKMKVSPSQEGLTAVVKGNETLGVDLGIGEDDYRLALGWQYRRQIIVSSNASVRFEWPSADFFQVRVGSAPPSFTNAITTTTNSEPNKTEQTLENETH